MMNNKHAKNLLMSQGKDAFFPGGDPKEQCPFGDAHIADDWIAGWEVGAKEYERIGKQQEAEEEAKREMLYKFEEFAEGCPWRYYQKCKVTGWQCGQCGLWYLKNYEEPY